MKTLLLFGGSFDPVHNGHVVLWHAARAALAPDAARILPVGNAWQKGRAPVATAAHRVAMLALAFPDAIVDERELQRAGPTYTVETIRELLAEDPHCRPLWLLGGDAFSQLHTWHEAEALARLVEFAVVCRAGVPLRPPHLVCRYREVACDPPPVSSTDIRARLARAESIRDMVPPAVCDYIDRHRLYR